MHHSLLTSLLKVTQTGMALDSWKHKVLYVIFTEDCIGFQR